LVFAYDVCVSMQTKRFAPWKTKTFSRPSGTRLTLEAIEALHDITENISPIYLRKTLMELYQTG